jgi:hypothetical protein
LLVILVASALALVAPTVPAAAAAHRHHAPPRNETLKFTVPTPVVLNVEHAMALSHNTTKLSVIWGDALCDAPTEPTPTQDRTTPKLSYFSVTIAHAKVATLQATLTQYGCGTLISDYTTSLARYEQRLAHEEDQAGGGGVTTSSQ